jgi:hypothetical protein
MKTALVMALVMVAACAADNEGSTTSAAAGAGAGGEQLGTGGAIAGGLGGAGAGGEQLGTGGAIAGGLGGAGAGGQLAAAPTLACPVDQVAGTACSSNGYEYLPGDPAHWCVVCYEWTPPEVNPPVNYQAGCLGQLASLPDRPDLRVQCVTSCDACLPCPSGVACVHP